MSSLLSRSNLAGRTLRSLVWGNSAQLVSQDFGTYNAGTAGMYGYAADQGWPAGTHIGLDVAMPRGTPIYAAESGRVTQSGFSDSFRPNPIWVQEGDGDVAIYGHLWDNAVRVGQQIKRGQLLGHSGEQTYRGTMTPDGTGPHIHFELREADGTAVNPVGELGGTGSVFGGTSGKSMGLPGWAEGGIETAGEWTLRIFAIVGGVLLIAVTALAMR